jgi:hypothetical protein
VGAQLAMPAAADDQTLGKLVLHLFEVLHHEGVTFPAPPVAYDAVGQDDQVASVLLAVDDDPPEACSPRAWPSPVTVAPPFEGSEIVALAPHQAIMEREPPTALTEALLDLADVAAQILAHMARWQGHSAPDAPPPGDVFRTLLSETLRPLLERRAPEAIEAAKEVLIEAVELIEAEILLVEPPHGPRGGRVGLRPPRRPC